MFQFFENWEGNLAHRSPGGLSRDTDLGKVCIEFLYFVLITRPTLYLLAVDGGVSMYLSSGKFAAWKS